MIHLMLLASMAIALVTQAQVQTPVAIVEYVESKTAGVEIMDYLSPGKVVKLAPNERIALARPIAPVHRSKQSVHR